MIWLLIRVYTCNSVTQTSYCTTILARSQINSQHSQTLPNSLQINTGQILIGLAKTIARKSIRNILNSKILTKSILHNSLLAFTMSSLSMLLCTSTHLMLQEIFQLFVKLMDKQNKSMEVHFNETALTLIYSEQRNKAVLLFDANMLGNQLMR